MLAMYARGHLGTAKRRQVMSKQNDKRRQTMKARCLEIIQTHPGLEAFNLPKNYRRLLRTLEAEGKIAYRTGQGWFARDARGDGVLLVVRGISAGDRKALAAFKKQVRRSK